MSSVEEYEKLRVEAEVKLQIEIYRLKEACEMHTPNKRLVANLVASLEIAKHNLSHSVLDLAMKMNAQLNEPRYTQYLDSWEEAAEEVMEVADAITGAIDEDRVPTPQTEEARKLRKDYARLVWSIESQLVAYKATIQTALSKESTRN